MAELDGLPEMLPGHEEFEHIGPCSSHCLDDWHEVYISDGWHELHIAINTGTGPKP